MSVWLQNVALIAGPGLTVYSASAAWHHLRRHRTYTHRLAARPTVRVVRAPYDWAREAGE